MFCLGTTYLHSRWSPKLSWTVLSEVHFIIDTCVFTCVTSVPCAPVLVGNPGSGRNAPVTLWHADIKIYITTNTANCVNNALMRELVLMILEEDIALCMQNFCIKCHRHGSRHISSIIYLLYTISILTTQSVLGMVPDTEVLCIVLYCISICNSTNNTRNKLISSWVLSWWTPG